MKKIILLIVLLFSFLCSCSLITIKLDAGTMYKDFIEININLLYDAIDTTLKFKNVNIKWPGSLEQLIDYSKSNQLDYNFKKYKSLTLKSPNKENIAILFDIRSYKIQGGEIKQYKGFISIKIKNLEKPLDENNITIVITDFEPENKDESFLEKHFVRKGKKDDVIMQFENFYNKKNLSLTTVPKKNVN